MASNNDWPSPYIGSEIDARLAQVETNRQSILNKVDKEDGKGLSSNDYTDIEKSKLAALPDSTELAQEFAGKQDTIENLNDIIAGATAGATAYQLPDDGIPYNDLSQNVKGYLDKANNAAPQSTTYTKQEVDDLVDDKVDKVSGKGLSSNDYTDAEKTKLANLPTGADLNTALNAKQDTIDDLGTIRSGASKGATAYQKPTAGIGTADLSDGVKSSLGKADTAVQPGTLANVATSGNYNDLSNKPTIPSTLADLSDDSTHRVVTDTEKTSWGSKYEKPEGGIPRSDLAEGVQSAIDSAGTAVQPEDLAAVATSGSYVDLADKPTLADLTDDATHRTVTDTEKTTWSGKQDAISDLSAIRSGAEAGSTAYQLPENGIPATDLDSSVRASLGKADTAIQDLSPITDLIPSEASSSNQLADKSYVQDAVASAVGGEFLGTSPSSLTEQQFMTWADSLEPDRNDYCYWDTVDSSDSPIYKCYKYTGSEWLFEYEISNPSFTPSEWETIRSGMTADDKAKLDQLYYVSYDAEDESLDFTPNTTSEE